VTTKKKTNTVSGSPVAPRLIQRYGWKPDIPDFRDLKFSSPVEATKLPPSVDLRPQMPKVVYDQGDLGSCTGNAIAGAVQFDRMRQKLDQAADLIPSRLFIYYNERAIEHTINEDSGAMIRDGIKCVAKQGVCFESGVGSWPYNIGKFTAKPPAECYKTGLTSQAIKYSRVPRTLNQMKGCLAAGFPFVIGFTVYDSFESDAVANTGVMPMPQSNEAVLGGHAVLVCGYRDDKSQWIVRNSWSAGWGDGGYFYMPYEYLMNPDLSDDFWTIRTMEAASV
jgi:C1A family cysteine protease